MPEPKVVQVMRAHKLAILAQEDSIMRDMANRWLQIEHSLSGEINALVMEAAKAVQEGRTVNAATLARMDRYQRLLWQTRAKTGEYVKWSDQIVTNYQEKLAGQGLTHAAEAIRAVYSEAGIIGEYFDVLHVDAIQAMIGLAADGTPLRRWLESVHSEAAKGITEALLDGIVKGRNPEKIARDMIDGLGMGLQTAMNTARTEPLRAYRQASLMQYQDSGVVSGYKRLAAHDERVCAGCLFTDGMLIETLDEFDEHNQGRCTAVPVVIGVNEPTWTSGQDWFLGQSESSQASILGDARFEAWKKGASLEDMVMQTKDATWGGAFKPTPAQDL